MKHRITRSEADALRWLAQPGDPRVFSARIWRAPNASGRDDPIGIVSASGRAGCRECGETIEKAADAIVFGFSPTGSAWDVGRAYIHAAPCRVYPEED